MNNESDSSSQSTFNDIYIELAGNRSNNRPYTIEYDTRSEISIPSRIARFADYPQIRPTNPLYVSHSTITTQGINPLHSVSKSSATLVNRRQKFDPQAPRRLTDWRFLAILGIILFFPIGSFAFAYAHKAHKKFRYGFITQSHTLNTCAFILCIVSIVCGIALIVGLLFGFDAWPRTNG